MTTETVTLDDLLAAREQLTSSIARDMPSQHKVFLLGFKRGNPDWSLLDLTGAADLPAVKWKQLNLDKMPDDSRRRMIAQLEKLFADL